MRAITDLARAQYVQTIRTAARSGDARAAGRVADALRFGYQARRPEVLALAAEAGVSEGDWENLMEECDDLEGKE